MPPRQTICEPQIDIGQNSKTLLGPPTARRERFAGAAAPIEGIPGAQPESKRRPLLYEGSGITVLSRRRIRLHHLNDQGFAKRIGAHRFSRH